jgi:hypothetical protein
MSQNFKNAFPVFYRENLRIYAHEYVTKYNIAVRYYVNGLGTTLLALMTQSGKGCPKWNLYNPVGKKICQIKKEEKIVIHEVTQDLVFHDNLINWALEESIKDMESRLFLAKMGYESALIRSIDDPWTPIEYDANN